MSYDGIYRILASRSLAVNSSGGVVASTASVSAHTRVVQLMYTGPVASTAGVRFNIGEVGSTVVHSTTSPMLFPNVPMTYLISPGQQIAALSNDASGIGNLTIVELGR